MRGGPPKILIFGHRRGGGGGVQPPEKSRNYLFLGKIFKFQGGGSGPPVPPSGSAHEARQASNMYAVLRQLLLEWESFLIAPFRDHCLLVPYSKQRNLHFVPFVVHFKSGALVCCTKNI